MPRKARIDAPGALQHIICRGIERRDIFADDVDKESFIQRLERVIKESRTPCYAWALIDNHFHLLLRTGNVPIATVMRRLLTGYVVSFNLRHDRTGPLFQNRYKSILCQEHVYLLELVRYIHLNPLRAGLVGTMHQLDRYPFCGHSILTGELSNNWQDTDYVLKLFGKRLPAARKEYRDFVAKGTLMGRKPELTGGGLIRMAGGWTALKGRRRQNIHLKGDERILGDSNFVESVLKEQHEYLERRHLLQAQGYNLEKVIARVARIFEMQPAEVLSNVKERERVKARSVLCYWAVIELKMTGAEVGRQLRMGKSAVSRAVARGEKIVVDRKLKLLEE